MSIMVTINCLTYNHEDFISEAIEGFLMQVTDFKYEILIGEDCSTDNTRKIVDEYRRKYPSKIRLITSECNVGVKENAKRLIANSKGKYIAECEGDDYWTDPYKLQKQVDYMEKNKYCTLCFHAAEIKDNQKVKMKQVVKPYKENTVSKTEDIIMGGGGFCPTASLLYPRKLVENLPDFYLNIDIGDYPLQIYLASKGYAYYIDEYMSVYRTGVIGSWTSKLNSKENKTGKMIDVYKNDIELLRGFDKYTDYSFSSAVEQIILKRELAINLLSKGSLNHKNGPPQKYVKRLGFKGWLKVYLHCYFPKPYIKLAEIKNFVSNRNVFN